MTPQQANAAVSKHINTVVDIGVRFRHAISDISDVLDYFLKDIKYEIIFHPSSISLHINIYTDDYQHIIDSIKKHRPRLIISRIETRDGFCTLDLDFNNTWMEEPKFEQPNIIYKEMIQEEMMKMNVLGLTHD